MSIIEGFYCTYLQDLDICQSKRLKVTEMRNATAPERVCFDAWSIAHDMSDWTKRRRCLQNHAINHFHCSVMLWSGLCVSVNGRLNSKAKTFRREFENKTLLLSSIFEYEKKGLKSEEFPKIHGG